MAPSTIEDRNGKRHTTEVNVVVVGNKSRSIFRKGQNIRIYIPMTPEEASSSPCWRIDLYEVR